MPTEEIYQGAFMKYLVTGGAGFIGSHIVEKLVGQGEKVRVLDNLEGGNLENLASFKDQIEFIRGDIRSQEDVFKAIQGVEYVFHQAALRSVPKSMSQPLLYHQVNVDGTLNLLEAARLARVKKFVFASSSSIYGDLKEFPQREDAIFPPKSPYALTKIIGEQYCSFYSNTFGLPTVCLRYFNVFGPRQTMDNEYSAVIPKFVACVFKGESPPIFGDGKQSRDFTYVANVVNANLAAIQHDVGRGEAINIACGENKTIVSLAYEVARLVGVAGVQPKFLPARAGDIHKSHADITRMKKFLGLAPQVFFEEGLKLLIQYFRNRKLAGFF